MPEQTPADAKPQRTVRILTAMAGSEGSWSHGDLRTCDADEADRLIAAGYAELPRGKKSKPETATTEPTETR